MNLNLNKNQLKKILEAHKNNKDVSILIENNQIDSGKHKFILESEQIRKLKNAKKNNTRSRLELKHVQIKKGGFLPIAIAVIEGVSALAAGASAVYTAITDAKHKKKLEQETIRHNKEMEKIRSEGSGLKKKKKILKKKLKK